MSIAVAPAHAPADRPPLRLSPAPNSNPNINDDDGCGLPRAWGDCCHYVLDHFLVRVSPSAPAEEADSEEDAWELELELEEGEHARHLRAIQKDMKLRFAREHNYHLSHPPSPSPSPAASSRSHPTPSSRVSLLEMQSEPIMTIRTVPRRRGIGEEFKGPPPDPEEFVQMQWYLAQMCVLLLVVLHLPSFFFLVLVIFWFWFFGF
jgi:hypothetical protein